MPRASLSTRYRVPDCICWERQHANLEFQRAIPLAVIGEDIRRNRTSFADIIVAQTVWQERRNKVMPKGIDNASALMPARI